MVMTDWFGGKDAVAQMKAGNDMLQPGYEKQYQDIVAGVKEGRLEEAVLDCNVKRILELILQTPRFKGYHFSNNPDLKAHAAITRRSAAEGMVLLKNDNNILPLPADVKRVALFGNTSYNFIAGGTGSGNVNRAYTVSLSDGLKNADYMTDERLEADYQAHIAAEEERLKQEDGNLSAFMPVALPNEMTFDAARLQELAAKSDVALITFGRGSGEFLDRESSDFYLSKNERQLLQDVCRVFHAAGKKVTVVLNVGGVIETDSWKALPDAILCAWQGGQEGGNSVTDVLGGKVSPSGKLTMTFPIKLEDHASSANFPIDLKSDIDIVNANKDENRHNFKDVDYTRYEEDIYVGYRYFDSFGKQVSYPFGYGLSYTGFEYANPSIKVDNGTYTVAIEIKNIGKMRGKEVVQLYVASPNSARMNKPEKELKAFAKTKELKPGETATVTLKVNAADMARYDEASSSWVVDAGTYKFMVGASSRDIKATLEADVAASAEKTNDILKLQESIVTLKR